jgi:hypothetical protein
MNIMQDKTPRNEQGQRHGLWETRWNEWEVIANFVNDEAYGYVEGHSETTLDKRYYAR